MERAGGAAAGRDHQLPVHGDHARHPRARPGRRGHHRRLRLTLVASVRRRRRDLALLKTLGFTRRQLAATVAWQASVAVGIGTVIGIPVGIVLGRSLWDVFAHQIDAVAQPFVPALTIAAIGVGAIVLANLIATIPGRFAADTPTALLLRSE